MSAPTCWLWPNRKISAAESARLRFEHNELVRLHERTVNALQVVTNQLSQVVSMHNGHAHLARCDAIEAARNLINESKS